MRSIANKEAADMKLAADYRALARDALRGRWKTAVLAGLLASALGANIVNATENITSNANRANQNSNITPGGSLELFSQANGGRLLAVLVVCIVVWTLFTLVVGGAVRLGYARFNLNLADGKEAAVSDLFSQKGRLWDGFCLKFFQGLYVALWSLLLVIPGIVKSYSYAMAPYIMARPLRNRGGSWTATNGVCSAWISASSAGNCSVSSRCWPGFRGSWQLFPMQRPWESPW